MAGRTRITSFMGRKQVRAGTAHAASQGALLQQFNSSMEDILTNLRDFVSHMEDVSPDILIEALEPTFGKSIDYCPKKTGSLVASGYLEARKFRGGAEVEIGYGRGGHPDYTIFVHEIPRAHEAPTRDKFLQAALDEDYFSILSSIPRLVREAAGT
jgi:hypothetical protein